MTKATPLSIMSKIQQISSTLVFPVELSFCTPGANLLACIFYRYIFSVGVVIFVFYYKIEMRCMSSKAISCLMFC